MSLKTLRLHGFKSFADSTEVHFPERITGVIGPNGCGKSNIVDAIRFVLGEQSMRLLRAKRIDDLIFAGNTRRQGTSWGEVALVFDNATRWLDIDYPDVEIRRILQRDGESKYFLNSTAVRLKDIQKMFMDVGVNKGHYSIISQGQVTMIAEASPEERRQFFEEAAGIVSYKKSKEDTLRRLDEVQKNIEEAGRFASEFESRMHGLKTQAGKAEKYIEYQTAYRQLFLLNAYRRFHVIREEMNTILAEIESRRAEQTALEAGGTQAAQIEQTLADERAGVTEILAQDENALRSAETLRADTDKALAAIEEKIYNLRRNTNEIDIAADKLARTMSGIIGSDIPVAQMNETLQRLKRELGTALEQAEHEWSRLRSELSVAEGKLSEEELRLDADRDGIISAHEAIAGLESTVQTLTPLVEEIRARVEGLTAQTAADRELLSTLENEQAAFESRRSEFGQSQTTAEVATKDAESRMEESRERLNKLRREMAEVEGRFRSLQAAEDAREGFSTSVKMVLTRFDNQAEFLGAVRDLLSFDPAYAKAVEAAMGPKLQHLVATSGETVKRILRESSGQLRGRVTFWALDLLPPPFAVPDITFKENMVGWATSLVRFDEKLRRLFENLLGRTLVVRDMDSLLESAKELRGVSIVTLEGEYYRAGAITAGPTTGAILMGRKHELTETESRLKELAGLISSEEESHRRACSELSASRITAEAAYRRYKDADEGHARTSSKLDSFRLMAQDRVTQLGLDNEKLAEKKSMLDDARSKLDHLQTTGGALPADAREILEDLRRQVQHLRADCETAADAFRNAQTRERELLRSESEYLELDNRRLALTAELKEAEERQSALKTELDRCAQTASACAETLKSRQAEHARLSAAIEDARKQAAEVLHRAQTLRDDLHRLEIRQTALTAERGNIRENVMNELQTNIEDVTTESPAPENWAEVAPEAAGELLKEYQLKMHKLGSVNVHAIEEYNEVSARHADLIKQMDDLSQARESLKEVLRKTDRICRERFADVFQRVAVHFQDVTKKLFLGGEGKLILTESDDLLESGVDIQLRPPGKGFTSIASRSGGEKALAGLCLLFSLFMEKPSPFCILDEVDAPLDDVNVGRLVKLIEDFSAKIQFIIVTHNKITMHGTHCLYGATMEEAGITKLVSVRMKKAQEAALAAAS